MKRGRTRKQQRLDSRGHFMMLARKDPGQRGKELFHTPPYQTGQLSYQARRLIKNQGEQMERKDVLQYIAEKYDIKTGVEDSGQKNPN